MALLLILLSLLLSYTHSATLTPPHISPLKSPSPSSSPLPKPPSPPVSKPLPPSSPITKPPSPVTKPSSKSTLDPKQLEALQSLGIPTIKDPCIQPSYHNATLCDSSKPFRHLLSLKLINCLEDVEMSITALKALSTLQDLQFINCPITPVHFPSELITNLHTFTCIKSLKKLTGVWLSRLGNLTDLTVENVFVNASGPWIIVENLKKLRSVTISHANLTGKLPKKWNLKIVHIDLSGNQLKGHVFSSLTMLGNLQSLNLSSNSLNGVLPETFGNLLSLVNVSFASNSISGVIPETLSEIPGIVHLDLSSNQFNGTIPKFISGMKHLKYLNLENNDFHGIMPFNVSFIKRLEVFKIGGNSGLCYNHTTISSKMKLGIARCDKYGLPVSPPPNRSSDPGDSSGSDDTSDENDDGSSSAGQKDDKKHGPSKIVLGVAIGLSSIVFLIVFLVLLSKWCK